MKAILLARVSTEEQKDAGNSLPAQLTRMETYCDRKDFEVIKKHSFDESAYKQKRDEFDKILDFLAKTKEKHAVCFDKVDRLSRNVFDKRVATLYEKAVADEIELHFVSDGQVIGPTMSAVEKFQFGMSLGLAKYFSDAISDNVKRAFEQKRRDGTWTGKAPFGYMNVALDAEKRLRKDIVVDPELGPIVVDIYKKYVTGEYSIGKLVKELERRKIRSRNGKKLHNNAVDHILKNPFYYGEMRTKYGIYPHVYKPLISKDLYVKAEEVRSKRHKRPTKTTGKRDFIFRGLLKCENCGCSITPELQKGNVYLSCTNAKGVCKREYVNEKVFLKKIKKDVFRKIRLSDEQIETIVNELKKSHEHKSEHLTHERTRLTRLQNGTQEQLDKLLDLLLASSITQDVYDKKEKELRDKQRDIGLQLESLVDADQSYHITAKTVLSLAQRAEQIFESSEIPEKRQLLEFVLQNPQVNGKNLEFTIRKPFDLMTEVKGSPVLLRR